MKAAAIFCRQSCCITKEARDGMRLSCQVNVKQDMEVEVPLNSSRLRSGIEVVSNDNVTTFIKEFVVRLPEERRLVSSLAVTFVSSPYETTGDFEGIEDRFKPDWDRFKVWDFKAVNTETAVRAYQWPLSSRGNIVMLNIRHHSSPDRSSPTGWKQVLLVSRPLTYSVANPVIRSLYQALW